MEQDLICGVCSEVYSEGERDPVLLPHCGHTFCRPCLLNLERNGALECPLCRRLHDTVPVLQLPVVYALQGLSKYFRRSKFGACTTHDSLLEFWCRRCRSSLCGHCLLEGHDRRYVVQMETVIEEKKAEVQRTGRQKLALIKKQKAEVTEKLSECLLRLATLCQEAEAISTSVLETKQAMDDAQGALGINSILECLRRLGNGHETEDEGQCPSQRMCGGSSSPEEGDRNAKPIGRVKTLVRRTGVRRLHKTGRSFSLDGHLSLRGIGDSQLPLSAEDEEGYFPCTKTSLRTEENSGMRRFRTPTRSEGSENDLPCLNEARNGALEASGDYEASTLPSDDKEVERTPPATNRESKADGQLWPLRCFAQHADGRLGRMTWEGERIHVYAVTSTMGKPRVTVQLSLVENLLQDSPEVFLDLSAKGRRLGRVYIRLWGHLRRARHFLALCLGTLGPSFRGSKFSKVESRDKPGECLRVSHYLTPEGTASALGLMEGLEWGGEHSLLKKAGLVVAASGGKAEYDGCFDICTRDHHTKKFSCPFGEVVEGRVAAGGKGGMEVVREVVAFHPVTDVSIDQVGVALDARRRF